MSKDTPRFSLEAIQRIYNNDTGSYIEICEDDDGIGMVVIRQCNIDGKITDEIMLSVEQAKLVMMGLSNHLAGVS